MPRLSITRLSVVAQASGGPRDAALSTATPATQAYIAAVEAADGQQLENGVLAAAVDFVNYREPLGGVCCLNFGRTLTSVLIPIVGAAPTGANLVNGDYINGAVHLNGTTKRITVNRNNNADPQDSRHGAVYLMQMLFPIRAALTVLFGGVSNGSTGVSVPSTTAASLLRNRNVSNADADYTLPQQAVVPAGLVATVRSGAAGYDVRVGGVVVPVTAASVSPADEAINVGANPAGTEHSALRVGGYSFGGNVDTAELNARMLAALNAVGLARFTPVVAAGVFDSILGGSYLRTGPFGSPFNIGTAGALDFGVSPPDAVHLPSGSIL